MLERRILRASGASDGDPVLVLLHGRGSDMNDLQGLAPSLPSSVTLVTPRAPHPGAPWGYGPGWAWYHYLGDDRVDKESLTRSLGALSEFLEHLPGVVGFEPGSLILGGFSQGGTTSLTFAMTFPGRVDGVVVLSGFLPNQESLDGSPEALGTTPVFWGHGTHDPAVPHELAVGGRERLHEAGSTLETRDYPMGHQVSKEEMADLRLWLERTLA